MRRLAFVTIWLVALALAAAATAQQKHKDQVLKAYLDNEFALLNAKLGEIGQRVTALEAEVARLKQLVNDVSNDQRSIQNLVKATDTSVNNQRISNQADLLSLKQDLANLRQELMSLGELIRRTSAAAQPAAPSPAPAPSLAANGDAGLVEGYISAIVSEREVGIVLETGKGLREGLRMNVYRAADGKTQIGIVEVTQVLDAKNARALIIHVKPGNKFEFSDIVRPLSP